MSAATGSGAVGGGAGVSEADEDGVRWDGGAAGFVCGFGFPPQAAATPSAATTAHVSQVRVILVLLAENRDVHDAGVVQVIVPRSGLPTSLAALRLQAIGSRKLPR